MIDEMIMCENLEAILDIRVRKIEIPNW